MHQRNIRLWLAALCLIMFAFAWGGSVEVPADVTDAAGNPSPAQNAELDLTYQDYANLIAGQKVDSTVLTKSVNPAGWLSYAEDMDQTWNQFEQKHLNPMRMWAAQELGSSQAAEGTVFYPFSGPDVANMLSFFPQAKNYLMIGLEPVGTLPNFQPGKNGPFFDGLKQSLSGLLQLNYFITKMMATDLIKRDLDGVLPVLLYFLGRQDIRVLQVNYWLMQPDGTITEKPTKVGERATGVGIPGVKIVFQRGEGEPEQNLFYFRCNLQEGSWRSNQQFVAFLKGFAPFRTFVKAASYLMFGSEFGSIRQFLLDQSLVVLQTDEGIPVKYFEPDKWHLHFYGKYSCPIPVFAKCFQADLADMYHRGQNTKPLPFVIGYYARPNSSNLLLATRKTIMAQEEAKCLGRAAH
jgi:hypothetical protein